MSQEPLNRESQITTEMAHNEELLPQNNTSQLIQKPLLTPPKIRIQSLDVHRGLTMVGMILVDNMGPVDNPPWFLEHPEWDGLSPADLIFPAFLFIMGIAIPLAVSKNRPVRLRNIIRIAGLFLIGFFLNLLGRKFDFTRVRILGILQRLSICYAVVLLVHLVSGYGRKYRRKIIAVFMLGLYLLYLTLMVSFNGNDFFGPQCNKQNNLTPRCNFAGFVDQSVFTTSHCWRGHCPDPEGIMSTIGAILTTYMGYQFSLIMSKNKGNPKKLIFNWLVISILFGAVVYPMTLLMALNKNLYSASFTLIVIAITGGSLTFIYCVVDVLPTLLPGSQKVIDIVTAPFKWLGLNPLAIFVGMDVLAIFMIIYIKINDVSVWTHFYKNVFASWISNQAVAATVFACFFLVLWTVVAGVMHKYKIYLRL